MGIDATILAWFDDLATSGALAGASSVLELGPQDCFFPLDYFTDVARRRLDPEDAQACASAVFSATVPFRERRVAFYRALGLSTYQSVDTYDERADYRLDLNTDARPPRTFDVVVDSGTSEHVFNIGNVFVFTHNALNVGGLSLRVLPTFGDNTHGFYNIHPTVYFDIARENGYDIVDFRYVSNLKGLRAGSHPNSLLPAPDFEAGLTSFKGCANLQSKITRAFGESIAQSTREGRIDDAHATIDYCFVALRKTRAADFVYPGQGVYLTEFSS